MSVDRASRSWKVPRNKCARKAGGSNATMTLATTMMPLLQQGEAHHYCTTQYYAIAFIIDIKTMCFIFASSQRSREPLPNEAKMDCQFCKATATVDAFQEKRVTYLYGCCPTKPQVIRGHHCRQCGKEWFQGDVQQVVYTQTAQPSGVVVTGKAVEAR